jgi:hypothetical protein
MTPTYMFIVWRCPGNTIPNACAAGRQDVHSGWREKATDTRRVAALDRSRQRLRVCRGRVAEVLEELHDIKQLANGHQATVVAHF